MKKTPSQLSAMKLVGVTCRTNNTSLFESDPTTNPIAAIVQKYFHENLSEKIQHRKNSGTTYCIYTDYESDFNGNYTYFIGEEVLNLNDVANGFSTLIIPTQNYSKFTVGPGKMPDICIQAWKEIWDMTPADFNGKRAYLADFEVYDHRSSDHQNVVFDIYIGIKT